jgi:hypothetical protein
MENCEAGMADNAFVNCQQAELEPIENQLAVINPD